MNRYAGNSGVVERIPEPEQVRPVASAPVYFQPPPAAEAVREPAAAETASTGFGSQGGASGNEKRPPGRPPLGGSLSGLLSKLSRSKSTPELEDLMLIAFMYLLYRETGDVEFLLIGGALLLG